MQHLDPNEAVQWAPKAHTSTATLPATEARPPFTLAHFPDGGWEYHEARDTFIARPTELLHVPGVGGVTEERDPSSLYADVRARGGAIIDPMDPRLGRFRNFIVGYPCDGGGLCWTFRCSTGPIRTGQNRVVWPKDSTYDEFCLHIVKSGIVAPMAPWTWTKMESRAQFAAAQKQQAALRNSAAQPAADVAAARLAKMRAAWERYNSAATETAREVAPATPDADAKPAPVKRKAVVQ